MPSFSLPNLLESAPVVPYVAGGVAIAIAGAVLALALWGGATSWAIATLPSPAPMATEVTVAELAAQVELLSAELRTLTGGGVSAVPSAMPEQPSAPLAGVGAGPEPAPTPEATRQPSVTLAMPEEPEPSRPPSVATPVLRRGDEPTADVPPDRSAVFSHMVVEGDKLNTIVRLYLPPDGELTEFTDRIAALNELDDVAIITLGQTLWIPAR